MSGQHASRQMHPLILIGLIVIIPVMIGTALVLQYRSAGYLEPAPTPTPTVTASAAALDYEAPAVSSVPEPELPGTPIPPCSADSVGPGVAPCYWDSGQFGGPESYIWTGQRKIQLVEPRP